MKNYAYLLFSTMLASCGISGEAVVTEESASIGSAEEFRGTFTSKKGVMHPISCYGYNIGFLKTERDENMAVCFDRLDARTVDIPSGPIRVKGHFENTSREATPDSPCEAGTRKIFYVEEWHTL